MYLSVVIPVYNSENTLKPLINRIEKTLADKLKYEIILVNDSSEDNSYYICKELASKSKIIKFIHLSKNFGQHNAILAGLHFTKGDKIIFIDDDLQTSPEEMWKLINKINEGFDVVYADYFEKKHSFLRNLGTKMNSFMAKVLIGKPKDLKISSYFIIRKYLVKELIKYENPNPYLAGLVLRSTDKIANVKVTHDKRSIGISNYNFIKLFRLWLNGLTSFSIKPLRFAFFLGALLSLAGFIFIIVLIIRRFMDPAVFLGWTSTIVTILFFSGIQLILIGLAGEYIGRIFLSQNKQPQYIIREKYNIDNEQ